MLIESTKASITDKATGNLHADQTRLGHAKVERAVRYLGVDVEATLDLLKHRGLSELTHKSSFSALSVLPNFRRSFISARPGSMGRRCGGWMAKTRGIRLRRLSAIIAENANAGAHVLERTALFTNEIRQPMFPFSSSPIFCKEAELTWPLFPLGPLRVQVRKAGTIAWR